MLLILSTALALAMPAALFTAPAALAAVPATPVVSATAAPDGVFVFWGPGDPRMWYSLLATVDGVTTEHAVWGLSYADRSLQPGQQATYRVIAVVGSTESAESVPVTAARLDQGWAEPEGARTETLEGVVEAGYGNTPVLRASATLTADADGKTIVNWGLAFARLPGPGTFELAADPTPGQVGFTERCASPGRVSGRVVVHDVVYGASGIPLQLGADFTWNCETGHSQHLTLRYHSAAPRAHVILEAPTDNVVIQGVPATTTWRLHNIGDAPATVGAITTSRGRIVDNPCSGLVLDGGVDCAILMDMSEPVGSPAGQSIVTLRARVTDEPGAATVHPYFVYIPAQAPVLAIGARLPNMVQLTWGASAEASQPLQGLTIERQNAPGDPWVIVARPQPTNDYFWVDHDVYPGMTASYRIKALASDGFVSDPSEPLLVSVPAAGLVWPDSRGVAGGSHPDDPVAISILSWTDPSGYFVGTGVDVSPDRNHLAVTTYAFSTHTNRLLLTDLRGTNVQVMDTTINGNAGFTRPFFSPDGRRVAYVSSHGWSGTISVIDIATKTRRDVLNQGILYGWSPDGTKLLLANGIEMHGYPLTGLRWVNIADDNYTAIAGTASVPDDDRTHRQSADVSRSGQIAWVSRASTGDTLIRTGPSAGSPTTLWKPTGCTLGEPRFDPTGLMLSIAIGGSNCSAGAGGTVTLSVPATGTAVVLNRFLTTTPVGPQWLVSSSVAPRVTVAVPAVTGASATATITATDTDDAVGGLTRTCRLDAGAWQTCGATLALTRLTAGRHTLTARATDPSGRVSADIQTSWIVDTTPPTTSLSAVSNPVLGNSLTLRWTGRDAGGSTVASYDTRYRYAAPGGGFGAFQHPGSWRQRAASSLAVGVAQGNSYCFSVRGRDRIGNLGAWSSERCTMAAFDDRALAISGSYRGTSPTYMFGTYTRTSAARQTLSRSGISARRVGIVATVCQTCGALDAWLGGVRIGTVNTSSTTTKLRQVLWLPTHATRTGTLVLRSTSTRPVYVDGIVLQK